MNLYIDIGTTNIKGASFNNKWEYLFYFEHQNNLINIFKIKDKIKNLNIKNIYISSVKPSLNIILYKYLINIDSNLSIYSLKLNIKIGQDIFLQMFAIQKKYQINNFHLLSLGTMNVLLTWENNKIVNVYYSLAIDQIYNLIEEKFELLKIDSKKNIDQQDPIINNSFLKTKIDNIKNHINNYPNIQYIYVTGGEYNLIQRYLNFKFIYKKFLLFEGFKYALKNYKKNDIYSFEKI